MVSQLHKSGGRIVDCMAMGVISFVHLLGA
jgi:hypothetical protein